MPTQIDISLLFDGNPSGQFRETVEQVNLKLRLGTITETDARMLIFQARKTEILSRFAGTPLEEGSTQTLEVETRRAEMMRQTARL